VDGKTAFAGKTGTSRDGWFAGFTPELVCVVYVGFDDGDDLGMKGADSAMPIWADFMQEALREHPEWNGDWAMPANVRKAEIDIRNGSLIRDIDAAEPAAPKETPKPSPTPKDPADPADDPAWATEEMHDPAEVDVSNVPAEFRRIELFVGGTVPSRAMMTDETVDGTGEAAPPGSEQAPGSSPTPPPINGTWQQNASPDGNPGPERRSGGPKEISVAICPLTGMRATSNCPRRELRTFRAGSEPTEFCTFHVKGPN
jgi:penicillin-binding protein 1B